MSIDLYNLNNKDLPEYYAVCTSCDQITYYKGTCYMICYYCKLFTCESCYMDYGGCSICQGEIVKDFDIIEYVIDTYKLDKTK